MEKLSESRPTSRATKRKRSIWFHLHFWIGWISALPIALVCLTGALLIFESPIFRWEHKELFQLEATGTPLSVERALERYRSAEPPLRVNHLQLPQSPRHSYRAYCTELRAEGERGAQVFLNPYTGELTRLGDEFSIAKTIIDLHRHLAVGRIGQLIVAMSSIVLALTCLLGLILWWPMRGRTFVRAWKRGKALDWHSVLGLVAFGPLIVMAITGVCFTWNRLIFGQLEKLQGHPSQVGVPSVTVPPEAERVPMDAVVERVESRLSGHLITAIQPSNGERSPHQFLIEAEGGTLRVSVSPYSGEELSRSDGSGTGPVGWLRNNFGTIHTLGPYHIVLRIIWGLLSLGGTGTRRNRHVGIRESLEALERRSKGTIIPCRPVQIRRPWFGEPGQVVVFHTKFVGGNEGGPKIHLQRLTLICVLVASDVGTA